ncbi:hypothetical protein [Brevundimonas aurantiaca]|jgi:hypothetical protein|uniref:Uncharacterized protein n=1 Tax=Brevundimonas aurantiaca TaxID=74316 RepID=A0A7W9C8V1_9CAUL|nr:hypothetical protein [Brevundimonas aurantiaca]MBB5741234.1 hypothetical protein [Brevundimonas aurantiaca]
MSDRKHSRDSAASGLAQGGLGGPEDQLLEAGQEEVFAREEVETGRIEHHSNTQTPPDAEEIEPSSPNAGSDGAAGAA